MIRKCEKYDQKKVLSLIQFVNHFDFQNNKRPFRYEDLQDISKSYDNQSDFFAVLEKDEKIIGTIALKKDDENIGIIRRFYLHPDYRRRGYGSILVDFIFDKANFFKMKTLLFRCNALMSSAIFLMTKKGFIEKISFFNADSQILILEKKIK